MNTQDTSGKSNSKHDGNSNLGYVPDPTAATNVTEHTDANFNTTERRSTLPELNSPSTPTLSYHSTSSWNPDIKSVDSVVVTDPPTPSVISSPSRHQVVILLMGTIGYLVVGMGSSWPNTLVSHLATDNTTLFHTHINPTQSQLDLMGSANFIGMTMALIPGGWMTGRIGRRLTIILSSFLQAGSWLIVALASNVETIIVGRLVTGITIAVMVVSMRTYMAEVASPSIRGMMVSILDVMKGAGYVMVTSLGLAATWYHIAFISLAMMLGYAVLIVAILPESPTYLMVRGQESEARRVLLRLRASGTTVVEELKEIQLMNNRKDERSGWSALTTKESMGNLLVLFGLHTIMGFSGSEIMKVNATRLFQSSVGLPLDPALSTVVITSSLLCGSLALVVLVDRIGRRWCLMIAMGLLTVSFGVLGGLEYLAMHEDTVPHLPPSSANVSDIVYRVNGRPDLSVRKWVSLACFVTAAFAGNCSTAIPIILSSEYFPTNVRSQGMSVCLAVGFLMTSLCLQLYSVMQSVLTQPGLYWTYAFISLLGIIYIPSLCA